MVPEAVAGTVRRYLRACQGQGLDVRFGVVYGSQATGRADKWSDIDLVVVSPHFDAPREYEDVARLWRLAARVDSRIEPIPCGEQQWLHDDASAIIEIARRQGEVVRVEEEQPATRGS
jgi:predicted nucleotidyltransferase